MAHWSDCAVHNAPALPVGECNCGGFDLLAEAREALKRQKLVRRIPVDVWAARLAEDLSKFKD